MISYVNSSYGRVAYWSMLWVCRKESARNFEAKEIQDTKLLGKVKMEERGPGENRQGLPRLKVSGNHYIVRLVVTVLWLSREGGCTV